MFELIEKLRQKSDRTKKQIAFLVALFFAGIIFVVWLSVVYPNFRQDQIVEQKVAKLEPSPIATFGETISSSFFGITEQFREMKSSISSFFGSVTYQSSTTVNQK